PEDLPEDDKISYPASGELISRLSLCDTIGRPGDTKPLILDGERLYLLRYFRYEDTIARIVRSWGRTTTDSDLDSISHLIDPLFPSDDDGIDWQRCAALNAMTRKLSVITGGPGSGKTTTVVKVLLLLVHDYYQRTGLIPRIALAAPTGKAAAHMQRSVSSALERLEKDLSGVSELLKLIYRTKDAIPSSGLTLHRLFTYSRKVGSSDKLPFHVIVVDECSMADIALFSCLIESVEDKSRVLLLGDKDQLSSVEAGSVLGDICEYPGMQPVYPRIYAALVEKYSTFALEPSSVVKNGTGLSGVVTYLTKSRRFSGESGIGKLASLVNSGEGEKAYSLFENHHPDLSFTEMPHLPKGVDPLRYAPIRKLLMSALEGFGIDSGHPLYRSGLDRIENPDDFLLLQSQFQILCALRKGPSGAVAMNILIEDILHREGRIDRKGSLYHGLPLIVTENDRALRLYNGDAGVVFERNGHLRAYFPGVDGARSVIPLQISAWEKSFALTVHKSQGSEYDHVVVILGENDSKVLSRELLYTAITRARKSVHIVGRKELFIAACSRRTERESGLGERLWYD
ncbi:MAG TPA: exodeoxyribonuclease V subunit alpha, partial [Spirochaetota bacterium]